MAKSTATEIQDEWQVLLALKKHVPHFDRYMVDQWKAIAAMVQVLRYDLLMPEIRQQWPDLDMRSAAEDARYWMDGGDVLSAAKSWSFSVLESG